MSEEEEERDSYEILNADGVIYWTVFTDML